VLLFTGSDVSMFNCADSGEDSGSEAVVSDMMIRIYVY
jgi:hypothetical protein